MLATAGFFPVGADGMGICDAVSKATSLLGFLPAVPVKCVALVSLGYSTGDDVAMLGARVIFFRLVVGFIAEPAPPVFPNFAGVIDTALRVSDIETHASWGF